jgi:ABC transporter with metal-binding/Fe-S-binding domain ATP-binding protein
LPIPAVKLGALYSGGKDSTFAILRAKEMGHQIVCLITVHAEADDSMLFHYPNSRVTKYLSDAMQIPAIEFAAKGRSENDEIGSLNEAMARAKSRFGIEGIVHGGIASNYQKKAFEKACGQQRLAAVTPLWKIEPMEYMQELIRRSFKIMIVGVSAMGLGKEWLGKQIDSEALAKLASLSKKYGFNLTFEGGEAETLVIDCPLFFKKLKVNSADIHWDGQRGMFEIRDVSLVEK